MSITQSLALRRVMTYPPQNVSAGSGSNAGNAYITIYEDVTFDDPTDNLLPITSLTTKTLYKYIDDESDPKVTSSYSEESDLVVALLDQLWYGSYTGSLDPPV